MLIQIRKRINDSMPTITNRIMNIIEFCINCDKDTVHVLDNENKTLQCLECKELTDISDSYVLPLNGTEIS